MTVKGLTTPKRVGCVELLFLCRYEGLARSLLLDWYLGSQKPREILMLLCYIILSSSGKSNANAQEVARRISGAVPRESAQKSTYQVPVTIPISRITLFAIFLSFSYPPLHPCRFIRPLFHNLLLLLFFCLPFSRFPFVCSCVSLLACRSVKSFTFCLYVWNWGNYCRYGQ